MLKAGDKKYFSEVMQYFFDTTKTDFGDYVEMVTDLIKRKSDSELDTYPKWLLAQSLNLLKTKGISPTMCIENKDIVRDIAVGEQSRKEGEFYTPEVWCKFGREYMARLLGDVWGSANVWDIACGTGNLMRTANYDQSKLFLSTLLDEDLQAVQAAYPDATIFQLDACSGIDMDEYNMLFSSKLPESLLAKLEANEPLVFYINPPYSVGYGKATDVAQHMNAMGFGRSSVDIYHQFLYRICLLVDTYQLTNCHIGVFGPTGWLQSRVGDEFRRHIFDRFDFRGGMSFPASEFANVGDGNDWLISMSVWSTRAPGTEIVHKPVILDACRKNPDGEPVVFGSQLIKPTDIRLQDWCQPADVTRYVMSPFQTAAQNFGDRLIKEPDNTIMTMMSENSVIDGVRRASVLTFSNNTSVPITPENFWRCVASFGARISTDDQDAFKGRQIFSAPDTTVEGWNTFLADSLAYMVFARSSYCFSYRDVEIVNKRWTRNNNFFPLSLEDCEKIITDPVILEDMRNNPSNNAVILSAIQWAAPLMSPAAKAFFIWCVEKLVSSLQGDARAKTGYSNWLQAYDASLSQVRSVPELWTEDDKKEFSVMASEVRSLLKQQVPKFGFLIDVEE